MLKISCFICFSLVFEFRAEVNHVRNKRVYAIDVYDKERLPEVSNDDAIDIRTICSHSSNKNDMAWIGYDLEGLYDVREICLLNRQYYCKIFKEYFYLMKIHLL